MVSHSLTIVLIATLTSAALAAPASPAASPPLDLSFARRGVPGMSIAYSRLAVVRNFPPAGALQARACTHGAWSCDGEKLQICNNGENAVIADCSTTSTKCSASTTYTGCALGTSTADISTTTNEDLGPYDPAIHECLEWEEDNDSTASQTTPISSTATVGAVKQAVVYDDQC
jgi:hypothetical protein